MSLEECFRLWNALEVDGLRFRPILMTALSFLLGVIPRVIASCAGALWARWELTPRWSVALRPELYWNPEGQTTSSKQLIHAYTGTVKYTFSPRYQRLVGLFEVRFDRSTGEQGGFYSGPNNELVPNQSLVLLGLLWSLDR